ncbi:AAA family ATPase [Bradyrhizobium sp. HKCCYLS3077]|uniref:AAA family ATPase n=1 Tax=Bradyrhizobium sp. HKCCYLS3077 TaxID=3420761 RepID=UPI003EBFE8E5
MTGREHLADADAARPLAAVVREVTALVRRRRHTLLAGPIIGLIAGLAYLVVSPAQFTATATVLVDSSSMRALQTQAQAPGAVGFDTTQAPSQIDIIGSDSVALGVIRKLDLVKDPEFVAAGRSDAATVDSRERQALDAFSRRLSVSRARNYVFDISFTSRDPVTAAKVANATVEAYIHNQVETQDEIRRRAGIWLQERIKELGAQVTYADRAILEFKEKNNIVDLGNAAAVVPGAPRRPIDEQQLADLNSQFATARAATSEARARLDRIEQVRKMDIKEAAVADALRDEVITRLRTKYLDLSARETYLSSRYGADHAAAEAIRQQMVDLTANIGSELGRIAASYQSDYEIARAREHSLEQQLASLVSRGRLTNRDRLGLAELESLAKVYHDVYNTFLQRYMDASQQQTFPITDARVISVAAPPTSKSKPNAPLALAIALAIGTVGSFAAAGLRDITDGVVRTGRQIEQALDVPCLAVLPQLPRTAPVLDKGQAPRRPPLQLIGHSVQPKLEAPSSTRPGVDFVDRRLRYAADDPLSVFAEAVRAIKLSIGVEAARRHNQVIGFTSTLPAEGKSTIACNLAIQMADAGKRVILLDADLRSPTLAGSLTPAPKIGLLHVLTGESSLDQAVGYEPDTQLAVLPFIPDDRVVHSDEVLASAAFRDLVAKLRDSYDYVILDLPPLAPVVDVRAALSAIDSIVFVVEWGKTRMSAVERHLLSAPDVRDRLLGMVLNKANLKHLAKFEEPGHQHEGYYSNLGYPRSA